MEKHFLDRSRKRRITFRWDASDPTSKARCLDRALGLFDVSRIDGRELNELCISIYDGRSINSVLNELAADVVRAVCTRGLPADVEVR